jgi:hypothetical protein
LHIIWRALSLFPTLFGTQNHFRYLRFFITKWELFIKLKGNRQTTPLQRRATIITVTIQGSTLYTFSTPKSTTHATMARGHTSSLIITEETNDAPPSSNNNLTQMQFSQIIPDKSQSIPNAKPREVQKLASLEPALVQRLVTDLSRILLFKGLNGDVIDRKKVLAEVLGDQKELRGVQSALLNEARDRLQHIFGFALKRIPSHMEDVLPGKFKDRLYLINNITDDEYGTHSVNIHSVHEDTSIEKGVLMIVLAMAFCKGNPVRSGTMKGAGRNTRWISEGQLYALMNRVDETLPGDPPGPARKKQRRESSGGRASLGGSGSQEEGLGQTPDLDVLLDKFVQADYLLKDKVDESDVIRGSNSEEKVVAYAMGPRANMEIGRKQLVMFCADLLGEQPDPTMLQEIEEDEDESSEEESEEEE